MHPVLTRVGIAVATALTFSLATPVAHADAPGGAAQPAGYTHDSGTKPRIVTAVFGDVAYAKNTTQTEVPMTLDVVTPSHLGWDTYEITADVRVNGVFKGYAYLDPAKASFTLPNRYGAGPVTLSNFTFKSDTEGTYTVPNAANFFARGTVIKGSWNSTRNGRKLMARFTKLTAFYGDKKAAPKFVYLQYLSGTTWKDLRKVRLNAKGSAVVTVKLPNAKKRTYRMSVKTTRNVVGRSTNGVTR